MGLLLEGLILFVEIIAAHCEIRKELVSTLIVQNGVILSIKQMVHIVTTRR